MNRPESTGREDLVLVLAPTAKDAEATREILVGAGIGCLVCRTIAEVCAEVDRGGAVALLTQEAILSDASNCLAGALGRQPEWSDFPLVVLTPSGSNPDRVARALDEVGPMTLLRRPVPIAELVSTIRAALRDRRRQYRTRELLLERDRQAGALREAGDRLAFALEAGRLGSWELDVATGSIACCETGRANFGLAPGDDLSLGRLLELVHPEDRGLLDSAVARALREGDGCDVECRFVRPVGEDRWLMLRGKAAVDARGIPRKMAGVSLDVTGRKRAEREIRESDERYRMLAENVQQLFWTCRPDGQCDYLSRQWVEYTGIPEADQLGLAWLPLVIHPDDQARAIAAWMAAVEDLAPYDLEYRILGADGRHRWFKTRGTPIRGLDGSILRWFGTCTDIDDQKQAEDALRESERTFRFLAESMPQVVWTADAEGRIDYVNRVLADYLGRSVEVALGTSWTEPIHPDDRALTRERWGESVATGRGYEVEHRLRRADGVHRWFLVRALAMRGPDGRVLRWFGTSTDVEEMKQANRALQDADHRKDEFLAMLAHELRNPLAAVNNAVTVLKLSDARENRDWAGDVVERQVKQLARLIDDLLDVSRIRNGKIRLRRERVDAGPILAQAVESTRPLIDARRHALEVAVDRLGLTVDADPTRLEQIAVNLLTNAAKYTEAGGRIWLSARREGDEVAIRVRDDGIGIPPEKLPEMFELFAQGERSIARSEGGLGIGLTIVQRLAEMHGGSVTATSEGLGRGSEFTVRLPAVAPAEATREVPPGPGRGPGRGARILVIDDNVDTARGMTRLLKLLGNEVRTAHDGPTGVEVGRDFLPDFVLLDIGLPGMDGYQVAEAFRGDPRLRDAVIIAISGYGQEDDRRRSKAAGFDHHLVKPVDHDALLTLLSRSP